MGIIFSIQRFSVNDGPGIRTTVFMKGCPLRCAWCHNPESTVRAPEIMFNGEKCVLCGRCVPGCERGCHTVTEDAHLLNRADCIGCGACVPVGCEALELCGRERSVEDVLAEVLADRVYYEQSGGGMTVSGGEPTADIDFTEALLRAAKDADLHTAVETCGYTTEENLRRLLPVTDLFLFDYKETDPEKHREFTGVDNARILENLRFLSEAGAKIILRCPLIPGYNARPEHLRGIAAIAEELPGILHVELEPYHALGSGKAEQVGRQYRAADVPDPTKEEKEAWLTEVQTHTKKTVKFA